jgi:hypothetical protein
MLGLVTAQGPVVQYWPLSTSGHHTAIKAYCNPAGPKEAPGVIRHHGTTLRHYSMFYVHLHTALPDAASRCIQVVSAPGPLPGWGMLASNQKKGWWDRVNELRLLHCNLGIAACIWVCACNQLWLQPRVCHGIPETQGWQGCQLLDSAG